MGAEQQGDLGHRGNLGAFVGAFVDELARSNVFHACICPGSRSTPLALLLRKRQDIRVWTHLDERSAAYFALGMAKALREPVALVSTSGTAAVNFAPAVVEAHHARVPLLVLTADRPPELRDVGAPQTIDQLRLYGSYVRWFVEMPLPEASEEAIRYARTVACRAAAAARYPLPGPVHVNFPFREPLTPLAGGLSPAARDTWGSPGEGQRPYVAVEAAPRRPDAAGVARLARELGGARRGLIVCGPQEDHHFPPAVVELARALDFPLLADPLSQVRCGPQHGPHVIDSYDAFLQDGETAAALAPEVVLRFGATPTSKALLLYLQQHAGCRQILVDDGGWNDPALVASDVFQAHPRSFCEALLSGLEPAPEGLSDWTRGWRSAARQAREALQRRLAGEPGLSEPRVFAELSELLPAGATLFAGNSMPVRDLDAFLPGSRRPLRFLANRGVSGIDGVVSTALGVSAVDPEPLVLVIGDLSFYHDMNGLLAAGRHKLRGTIVLLNNDGGGIFSLLPQADEAEHFEELFGTPHGLDFRPAAEMYGLAYRLVDSWEDFRAGLRQSLESSGVTVIEVRTDRRANARLHRELWRAVSQALRHPAGEGASP